MNQHTVAACGFDHFPIRGKVVLRMTQSTTSTFDTILTLPILLDFSLAKYSTVRIRIKSRTH